MGIPGQLRLSVHQALPNVPDRSWRVLHVRSNYERRVAQHLAVRAIEHYLPLYQEHVRWTDRNVLTERPLFPGYLFARYLPNARIAVLGTPGVVRSLGEGVQCLVSATELDRIREGLCRGLTLRPHSQLPVGTRVRIRNGVFEGVEGVVAELRRQSEVVITVAGTHQFFSLQIEVSELEVLKQLGA